MAFKMEFNTTCKPIENKTEGIYSFNQKKRTWRVQRVARDITAHSAGSDGMRRGKFYFFFVKVKCD